MEFKSPMGHKRNVAPIPKQTEERDTMTKPFITACAQYFGRKEGQSLGLGIEVTL